MKKITAIILSMLFCVILTCCGGDVALAGLPEIPRDERIYYNGIHIEKGEGLDQARPVTDCPYDKQPTLDEAEADGALIEWYNYETKERIIKNFAALERFVYNLNRGIEDSLLITNAEYTNGKETVTSGFLYYTNGVLKKRYGFEKKIENTYADGDKINLFFYDSLNYQKGKGVFLLREYYPIDSTSRNEIFSYGANFVELKDESLLYKEGVTEKFVNVAGIYEGDSGEAKLYAKYPFEEGFPTAKEIFDLGGVVIFDNDFAVKAYNIAAIERFKSSLKDKVPDTLFVYTDNGVPGIVMYSFTGESLIISKDTRLKDPRSEVFTTEIFSDNINLLRDTGTSFDMYVLTCSESKMYQCYDISIVCNTDDNYGETMEYKIHQIIDIPQIQYVTEYIVAECEAGNYK